ncbi:MAG: OmpA family protein [Gammaproteobacteria bacterium]
MQKQYCLVTFLFFALAITAGCSGTGDVVDQTPVQETSSEPVMAQDEPQPAITESEPEVTLDTVFYFDFDDATIRPSARETLAAHADRLKDGSEAVRIEGYADERGTESYNLQLGQRRADAVRDLLVSMGVNAGRITTVSYGETHPTVVGSDESAWQKNRRVELK